MEEIENNKESLCLYLNGHENYVQDWSGDTGYEKMMLQGII